MSSYLHVYNAVIFILKQQILITMIGILFNLKGTVECMRLTFSAGLFTFNFKCQSIHV